MMISSKLLNESSFILDSKNYTEHKSHLYGFAFDRNVAYVNCNLKGDSIISDNLSGAYIAILENEKELRVVQDTVSTFMLYLYRYKEYWCISNSFYKLCEHVKALYPLSLNRIYVEQYFSTAMSPLSTKNTLAEEVSIIPLFSQITIEKKSGKLNIEKKLTEFSSVNIDSVDGMAILDNWISKWRAIIHSVYTNGYPIKIDLTGGYDSRVIFSLAYSAGIDFSAKNINVHSIVPKSEGEKRHYLGDYEIATHIAELLGGFKLNQNEEAIRGKRISGRFSYEITKDSMLGIHKEGYFEPKIYDPVCFHLGGFMGEPVRGKVRSLEQWLNMLRNPFKVHAQVYSELINDYEEQLSQSSTEYEALRKFYLSSWGRNHYGQCIFKNFLIGKITLSPFSDADLLKLSFPDSYPQDAIFALIIQRTCPALMGISFADGSDFSGETKCYVKYLCKKYRINPFDTEAKIDISNFGRLETLPDNDSVYRENGNEWLYTIFKNPENKELFCNALGTYGCRIYEYADSYFNNKELFFYNQWCFAVVAIIEFLRIQNEADVQRISNELKCAMKKYPAIDLRLQGVIMDLQPGTVGRIDLKNIGNQNNDVKIIYSSDSAMIKATPKWFLGNDGKGVIIHSLAQKLRLRIQIIGTGQLKIVLRGKDVRDSWNERIPIRVDYTRFCINEKAVFETSKIVTHDTPYVYVQNTCDKQIIEIDIEWKELRD